MADDGMVLDHALRPSFRVGQHRRIGNHRARRGGDSADRSHECVPGAFPGVRLFSLPRMGEDRYIELGVRGEPGRVAAAIADLKHGVSALGLPGPSFGTRNDARTVKVSLLFCARRVRRHR